MLQHKSKIQYSIIDSDYLPQLTYFSARSISMPPNSSLFPTQKIYKMFPYKLIDNGSNKSEALCLYKKTSFKEKKWGLVIAS